MTSLRTRILVIVALALTPLIALNVAGYLELRSSAIEDARSDAVAAIRSVAAAQEALLEREVSRMALIAALPEVRSAPDDVGACYDLFGLGDAGGGIGGRYLVVDAAGMGLCGTTEISAEIDYSDRAWVRTPLENGGRAAGDFVISRPTGTPLLPIGQRIEFATGEPGVLGSGIPLRSEALLPADLPVPPNSRVRLLDVEGTLLASRPEEPLGVRVDDAERLDRILAVDAGVRHEGSTLLVVERIEPASLAGPAALVVVETSLGPVLAAADRRLLRDLGVALCAVLLALALTAVLSQRQVAVPIQLLARAFERTADGIYAPLERRRGQIRELRTLHRDFDAMVSRLRDREARLVHARRDQEERARYARILNELSSRSDEPLAGQVRRALRALRTELGADLAFVSRIDAAADRFEYRLVDSDEPLAREGDVASLAETYCALIAERDELIDVDDLDCSPHRDRPGWEALPMRSFVGVPLRTAEGDFGSVGFAARAPRGAPLSDAVRDFLPLFSRWIGTLLERAEAAAALERSNAELEQFAYVASHDLREPLRVIAGYSQLLQRHHGDALGAEGAEYVGHLVSGAHRLDRLISDLLAFSRVGRSRLDDERAELGDVVDDALAALAVQIEESGARVEVRGPRGTGGAPEPLYVAGSASLLRQMLQNLIGNAIKFRGDGAPRVEIELERNAGEAVIAVRDDGIGIAPEHRERIFEIFQRLHGRDAFEGTGIGLALVRRIVERHGGAVTVASELGAGSTFRVTLPLAPAPSRAGRVRAERAVGAR